MSRVRAHIKSHAVGYLALFVALGGTSYAAATLPRNSVTAKQIAPRSVGASELKDGAVTSRKVRGLRLEDFKPGELAGLTSGSGVAAQGTAGAKGAPGPQGPEGAQGPPGSVGPPGPAAPALFGEVIYDSAGWTLPKATDPANPRVFELSGTCAPLEAGGSRVEPTSVVSGAVNPGDIQDADKNVLPIDWFHLLRSEGFDSPDDEDNVADDGWRMFVYNDDPDHAHPVFLDWICATRDAVR